MEFLTNEKLTIVGAAGMIGSNMAQTAMMMKLTPNICLYDPYAPALEGVAEELYHCGFEGVNLTYTSDIKEALTGAAYIVSSGGAARKAGMTREDLLKGNAEIAAQFGKDIRQYCPDVKHVVVVFNPADITGLITLLYSGLKPSQVSTLAALDSTRLQNELAKFFKIPASKIQNCRTYGGHGEQMAVFASTTTVDQLDRYYPPAANRMGCYQATCYSRRKTHYRPARTFLFPKSGLSFYRNDRCCYGRCTFPVACRNLCFRWKIQPHHDGDGNLHH